MFTPTLDYKTPTAEQTAKINEIAAECREVLVRINLLAEGPEKAYATRALQEVAFWGSLSVVK